MAAPSHLDRSLGALLGLATGDALGTTLEFTTPGTFTPITDMQGGGPFALQQGQWTDDTSMALCLAESLAETSTFDPVDQLDRYLCWYDHGHWSSTGRCFDIGNTTRQALAHFRRTRDPRSGPTDDRSAGNGSLMRLVPVPVRYALDPEAAVAHAAGSSRTTHGARTAVDACRFYAGLVVGALQGLGKDELLSPMWSPVAGMWERDPLHDEVARVAAGSYQGKSSHQVRGSGYVVDSLEAALWAFATTDTFEAGALAAVNLGDDADTTGAVFGQLAGAYYGVDAIPRHWRERLAMHDDIIAMARRLHEAAMRDRAAAADLAAHA